MTFHFMFVQIIFSWVCVAKLPNFGKELLSRSLCILAVFNVGYFPF